MLLVFKTAEFNFSQTEAHNYSYVWCEKIHGYIYVPTKFRSERFEDDEEFILEILSLGPVEKTALGKKEQSHEWNGRDSDELCGHNTRYVDVYEDVYNIEQYVLVCNGQDDDGQDKAFVLIENGVVIDTELMQEIEDDYRKGRLEEWRALIGDDLAQFERFELFSNGRLYSLTPEEVLIRHADQGIMIGGNTDLTGFKAGDPEGWPISQLYPLRLRRRI